MTEDKTVGWPHRLNGHEPEQAPGVGDGQRGLVWCCPWGRKESDMTEWLSWTDDFVRQPWILVILILKSSVFWGQLPVALSWIPLVCTPWWCCGTGLLEACDLAFPSQRGTDWSPIWWHPHVVPWDASCSSCSASCWASSMGPMTSLSISCSPCLYRDHFFRSWALSCLFKEQFPLRLLFHFIQELTGIIKSSKGINSWLDFLLFQTVFYCLVFLKI